MLTTQNSALLWCIFTIRNVLLARCISSVRPSVGLSDTSTGVLSRRLNLGPCSRPTVHNTPEHGPSCWCSECNNFGPAALQYLYAAIPECSSVKVLPGRLFGARQWWYWQQFLTSGMTRCFDDGQAVVSLVQLHTVSYSLDALLWPRVCRELLDTVKARKLAYYGHTMRKQGSCLEKEIM